MLDRERAPLTAPMRAPMRARAPESREMAPTAHAGELVFSCEVPLAASMLGCLRLAWQEAQSEARRTYEDWRGLRGPDAYLIYRATQDRADAAQDALAHCSLMRL
jgi:hypothetical protein